MRRRILAAAAGVLLAAAALLTAAVPTGAATVALTPLHILTVGDSMTTGTTLESYRGELDRLLRASDIEPTWSIAAVYGSRCTYWQSRIHDLLVQYDPDVVILACGTNDDTATPAARDQMGTAIRVIAETVRTHRGEVTPVRQIGAYIQLSDPYQLAPSQAWLPAGEERANAVLRSNYAYYLPYWTSIAVADLSRIPGNPVTTGDGIHPTPYGYRLYARLLYDAGAARGWWPTSSEPPPCDLYGHAMGTAVPPFTACPVV